MRLRFELKFAGEENAAAVLDSLHFNIHAIGQTGGADMLKACPRGIHLQAIELEVSHGDKA